MNQRDHRFVFVRVGGQCRRGRSCEAWPVDRVGWKAGLSPSERRRVMAAPLRAEALICHDCRYCWTCAPSGPCTSRQRPGFPDEDTAKSGGSGSEGAPPAPGSPTPAEAVA